MTKWLINQEYIYLYGWNASIMINSPCSYEWFSYVNFLITPVKQRRGKDELKEITEKIEPCRLVLSINILIDMYLLFI